MVNQSTAKVYDNVSDQEFEVQIPFNESLWLLKFTHIEIKIMDQGNKLLSHEFDVKTI